MAIKTARDGFTLVEIMIVVAIIGLLAAIAIPNFMKAREKAQKSACISNLKQLQGAAQVWALETYQSSDAMATEGALCPDYIRKWPTEGSTAAAPPYDEFAINENPVCPIADTYPEHSI